MSRRSSTDTPLPGSPPVVLHAGLATYELVRTLGQGHHGELLLARQRYHDGLGGLTVLKRLNRVARQLDYQRLVEEARLGGQLQHPNIVSVQLMGGSAEEPILLIDHVEGDLLGDLMRRATGTGLPLSETFACHMTAEVADALHYAHARVDEKGRHLGIVHRDVTPQGILVGRQGEVMLTDFGGAWSRLEGRMSTEGDADFGPLAYSSPERVAMDPLDGRSDLFSLGLVFLQLLTGRHLFDADARYEAELRVRHLRARGDFPGASRVPGLEELGPTRTTELMRRIRTLSTRQVEEATRSVPEALRSILHRVLAPRREDRYATGAELCQALRDYLWASGQRYGRMELAAEMSALHEAALRDGEGEPSNASKRGGTVSRGRRKRPVRGS
ncbi:serine/threonine-protein kinase [Archangium sp.]|uniref:serine/threonine-protein kinase n=1 Tax=Archangium sp. TaxID=1872627 RepID=UPI002EDAFFB3